MARTLKHILMLLISVDAVVIIWTRQTLAVQLDPIDHSLYSTVKECLECHTLALPTHKRNRPTWMEEEFPLDAKGRMLCTTCHDCSTGDCFLRKPVPELCANCHESREKIVCSPRIAHLGDSPDVEQSATYGCLGCHDGVSGPLITQHSHSVEVPYFPGEAGKLKMVKDERVVFVDGRVTCISCHNPYSSRDAKLVKSNSGSLLCLSCHDK